MNRIVGLLLFLIIVKPVKAQHEQAPALQQKITLHAEQETIRNILKKIEKQSGKGFSYNSKIIDQQKKKSVSFKEKTIPEIIAVLFDNGISCNVKGNYIVLYKNTKAIQPAYGKEKQTIKAPADSRQYFKPSATKNDTTVRYFIDVIVTNSEGKDSVIQTKSVLVPTTHIVQIKDDSTIILLKKDSLAPKQ